MTQILKIGVLVLGLTLGVTAPCLAQRTTEIETITSTTSSMEPIAGTFRVAEDNGDYDNGGGGLAVSARQAGQIAKSQYPGSKVLKVVLRGDVYAVTLRGDGELTRVFVDGNTGAIQ